MHDVQFWVQDCPTARQFRTQRQLNINAQTCKNPQLAIGCSCQKNQNTSCKRTFHFCCQTGKDYAPLLIVWLCICPCHCQALACLPPFFHCKHSQFLKDQWDSMPGRRLYGYGCEPFGHAPAVLVYAPSSDHVQWGK